MTDMSVGNSKESRTHHISHSCGHTAVFPGSPGSHSAVLPCFAFIRFSLLLVLAAPSYTRRWWFWLLVRSNVITGIFTSGVISFKMISCRCNTSHNGTVVYRDIYCRTASTFLILFFFNNVHNHHFLPFPVYLSLKCINPSSI